MKIKMACVVAVIIALVISPYCQPTESGQAEQMLRLINQERVKRGLSALRLDASLNHAAALHSRGMAQWHSLSHQLPGEASLAPRIAQAGAAFDAAGENVAHADSIAGAHQDFMVSPGHRGNILDPRYNAVGIGAEPSGEMLYVTEDFARLQNKYSAADFASAVLASVDGWRKQVNLPRLAHVDQPKLQEKTCEPDLTAQKISDFIPGAAWTVVFTSASPDQLPDALRKYAREVAAHRVTVAACRLQSESFATYSVAVVFFR